MISVMIAETPRNRLYSQIKILHVRVRLQERRLSKKEDWISEEDLVHSVAFSLENLRVKYPEPNDMVSAMWGWLSSELAYLTVGPDRTVACLAMLDEIVRLGGFKISDDAREYFNDHFLTPYVIRRLDAVRG